MSISQVLASAAASSKQYSNASEAMVTLTNLHLAPADVIAAVTGLQNISSPQDINAAAISAAKAGLAIIEAVAKAVPVIGGTLSVLSLVNNISKASDEIGSAGGISVATTNGIAGDVAALAAFAATIAIGGSAGAALAIGLTVVGAALTVATAVNPALATQNAGFAEFLEDALEGIRKALIPGFANERAVIDAVNINYRTAITPPRRDPLAIDLDGDGIETLPAGGQPVLFDHDADGVKTGTGWLKGDDAWLAMDRDGNGSIDSGRELFGVDTLITKTVAVDLTHTAEITVNASTGFEALAALDANHDKLFDAQDAAFAQVRLWQDLNSDGVSQAEELSTLADKGIVSISLVSDGRTQELAGGNSITGKAVVTRTNGATGEADAVALDGTAANLDLSNNPFYRELGMRTKTWTGYAAMPRRRRCWAGLRKPSELLIRTSLYQRM